VTGYHLANFGLLIGISVLELSEGTGRTDNAAQFIMPPSLRGRGIIMCGFWRKQIEVLESVFGKFLIPAWHTTYTFSSRIL